MMERTESKPVPSPEEALGHLHSIRCDCADSIGEFKFSCPFCLFTTLTAQREAPPEGHECISRDQLNSALDQIADMVTKK